LSILPGELVLSQSSMPMVATEVKTSFSGAW
jgi:hypothetical protein